MIRQEKRMNEEVKIGFGALAIAAIFFIGLFTLPWTFTSVNTYESGVKVKWGKIQEQPVGEGVVWKNPISTKIQKIDMRERKVTLVTNTVSKEGLKFGVSITVRYRVKEGNAVNLVTNLETPLHELINAYANSTIDDIATGKDKNEMYSETGRVAIVLAVKEKLNSELTEYATVGQVIFESISLPTSITQAIEAQQAELEKIKQKENQKQVAEKEKEIRIIEAQGIAEANNIIQRSLTREYLQYEAIQKFNPDAQKIYIPSSSMVPTIDY